MFSNFYIPYISVSSYPQVTRLLVACLSLHFLHEKAMKGTVIKMCILLNKFIRFVG